MPIHQEAENTLSNFRVLSTGNRKEGVLRFPQKLAIGPEDSGNSHSHLQATLGTVTIELLLFYPFERPSPSSSPA